MYIHAPSQMGKRGGVVSVFNWPTNPLKCNINTVIPLDSRGHRRAKRRTGAACVHDTHMFRSLSLQSRTSFAAVHPSLGARHVSHALCERRPSRTNVDSAREDVVDVRVFACSPESRTRAQSGWKVSCACVRLCAYGPSDRFVWHMLKT